MTFVEAITNAGSGWSKILAGKPDWNEHFAFDAPALNRGFVLYFAGVLFSIVALAVRYGMPVPVVMLIVMAGYILPVLAFIFATSLGKRVLKFEAPIVTIYVPGLYMLALMAFIGGLTLLVGVQLWGVIVTLTAFFLFRLARVAAGADFAPALGFALINFLAGLPLALYMMGGGFAVFA
ncbi:hypothetical protein [Pelagibacterium xiamenense]|uniref:hypothetical protein n=1 Tax=Pelagibacterium xiamenense TaxID=2901140 RepID=UPI001E3D3FE7|nr:hypothetical protein [Pelagibacterium xiamenense]MCD7058891.1 hypothetical protein [Pelagibacterium xiamenense]